MSTLAQLVVFGWFLCVPFVAGQVSMIVVQHDAFAVGNDVTLSAPVSGDAHLGRR